MINHGFFGGGAERCVRDLRQGMMDRGHDVQVWVANPAEGLPANVKAICRGWERSLLPLDILADWTDWRHRGSIEHLKSVTREKFDVVHLHHMGGGWMSLKALSEMCERMPVVWTHHDEWAVSNGFICDFNNVIPKSLVIKQSSGLNRLLKRSPYHDNFKNNSVGRLLDKHAPRTPQMIAPSRHMLSLIQKCGRFPQSASQHLYHGLPFLDESACRMDRLEARKRWGIPADCPVVLMVAAHLHDVHKGIALGIEAVRKLAGRMRPHVMLLGKNAEMVRARLAGLEVTTGYAGNDEMLASAYRAADVTLVPSFGESLSLVCLESLACQTPLVAFRIGGPAEIIGDNLHGFVVEAFSTDQMALCLEALLAEPAKHLAMGEAGLAWAKEHCDMRRFLSRVEDAYREVISRSGGLV